MHIVVGYSYRYVPTGTSAHSLNVGNQYLNTTIVFGFSGLCNYIQHKGIWLLKNAAKSFQIWPRFRAIKPTPTKEVYWRLTA